MHRILPKSDLQSMQHMSEIERANFNKEMLIFIATMAAEIKDLSRMLDTNDKETLQFQHNKQIVSFLCNVS